MTMADVDVQTEVRPSRWEDRDAIYGILMNSGIFGKADADCVDEMFVETWGKRRDDADNYRWLSCWHGGEMAGFACYGLESLTKDTWDLFWICVLPAMRGKGAGRALMVEAEQQARLANGRVMVIYTSSTEKYAPARRLYEGAGFVRTAVVPDYYADGDDLNIYWKRIGIERGEKR
jgi:ribosomal protein S18 acetylase RimI-like enzyme